MVQSLLSKSPKDCKKLNRRGEKKSIWVQNKIWSYRIVFEHECPYILYFSLVPIVKLYSSFIPFI